jgi:hypothetical protein
MSSAFSIIKVGGAYAPAPIEMWVTLDEVGIRMALDDFLNALAAEVGNPTLLVTQAQLLKRLQTATQNIAAAMKNETHKVA